MGLFGLFLFGGAQLGYCGWQTLVKRILLSISAFSEIGGFLFFAIWGLGQLHVHSLYEHVSHLFHDPTNPRYSTKIIYFAPIFWGGRILVYAILWFLFSRWMNNFFARTDQTDPKVYKKSKLLAAAFIVVFALTESAISWDMIMSLDPHWYSTLFGWYNFASYGCAAWAMTILIVVYLKSKGYLERINENHIHDLGKMLFGFSIFWTYLWFDQFMLQWYANIPEDTMFWAKRFANPYFKFTVFAALGINFVFPLFVLIKRGAKRNFRLISFGAALLIFGHYVDFFNYTFFEPNQNTAKSAHHGGGHEAASKSNETVLYAEVKEPAHGHTTTDVTTTTTTTEAHDKHTEETKPAAHGAHDAHGEAAHDTHGGHGAEAPSNYAGIGIGEILIFIGFLGVFLYMFFNNLAKRPIIPENDPYLKEAERLTVTYA
jgi:hypothetical protein